MPPAKGHGFAVIDVETSGLSYRNHRVVEIAVVLTDTVGNIQHEWSTRVNPLGPVGPTHIHGLTQAHVQGAPTFPELIPQLVRLLAGRVLVAHNASFDQAFIAHEFARANWGWPAVPILCTLEESRYFLPHLGRRRLVDCCWAQRIALDDAHRALGDARATARLLRTYLEPGPGIPAESRHRAMVAAASGIEWPLASGTTTRHARLLDASPHSSRPVVQVSSFRPSPAVASLLERFTITDALEEGAPSRALPYLELLADVLEDGQITASERDGLADAAAASSMDEGDVVAAHRGLIRALAREATEDGRVTREERGELLQIAGLVDVHDKQVRMILDGEEERRLQSLSKGLRPLPANWQHGAPLHVGDRIVFTGCDQDERAGLERRSTTLGVRVTGSVSRRTTLLVTDGTMLGVKHRAAEQIGTRRVTPRDLEVLLNHLQPYQSPVKKSPAVGQPTKPPGAVVSSKEHTGVALPEVSPSDVRAWALEQGIEVSARGRLPRRVIDAYLEAN